MSLTPFIRDGISIPRFLYGTAWKEQATQHLTELAIAQGFRGIDTANQRKHYHEAAVGDGIKASIAKGLVQRDDLFLQTKFTFRSGQDQRLPYDPSAPIEQQVAQSFASSLTHLGTDRIDAYVLHGPSRRSGLGPEDWSAWRAMEAIHDQGLVRWLGISNVSLEQLRLLVQESRVRPSFVQNRCYAVEGWDRAVREYCDANAMIYQGFSLLTANRTAVGHSRILAIAKAHDRSAAQVIFRFATEIGMLPLTGTSNLDHMREDLGVQGFCLAPEEVATIENLAIHQ